MLSAVRSQNERCHFISNSTNNTEPQPFGHLDTSFRAAGKESGLRKLCENFYQNMGTLPEAKNIENMHTDSVAIRVDKLTLFLTMWLGGPKTYREDYKGKSMPDVHRHLVVNEPERDAWLSCMDKAIDQQDYTEDFKSYLKTQFRFPAEMIRKTSKFK